MPSAYTNFLSGLDYYFGPSKEILLVGSNEKELNDYSKLIQEKYIPNKTILMKTQENSGVISSVSEFTASYPITDKNNLIYICENYTCQLPVSSEDDLLKKLQEL